MPDTSERPAWKFLRDAVLTIVGGLVIEPTLKGIHVDVSPYLRQIWTGILVFITFDAAKRYELWGKLRAFQAPLQYAKKSAFYLVLACLGIAVVWFYWWSFGKLFKSAPETLQTFGTTPAINVQKPELYITDWERVPVPLVPMGFINVRIHIKSSLPSVDVVAKYSPILVDGHPELMDYDPRKIFEEGLWKKSLAAAVNAPDRSIPIMGTLNDYWLPMKSLTVLTADQIKRLHKDKTMYFMGQIRGLDGTVLLEFCAHTGSDDRTVLFCLDHNGPPRNSPQDIALSDRPDPYENMSNERLIDLAKTTAIDTTNMAAAWDNCRQEVRNKWNQLSESARSPEESRTMSAQEWNEKLQCDRDYRVKAKDNVHLCNTLRTVLLSRIPKWQQQGLMASKNVDRLSVRLTADKFESKDLRELAHYVEELERRLTTTMQPSPL